jgi:DNA primase
MDLIDFLGEVFPFHSLAKQGKEFLVPCPYCGIGDIRSKSKLSIHVEKHVFHCWVCGEKGNLRALMTKVGRTLPYDLTFKSGRQVFTLPSTEELELPGHISAIQSPEAKAYLNQRGVTDVQIMSYRMGYIERGRFRDRIFVPTIEDGECVYFVARSMVPVERKYLNPPTPADYVFNLDRASSFRSCVICEGVFSAIAAGENAVAIFGKYLRDSQLHKLIKANFKEYVIMLDPDAPDKSVNAIGTALRKYGATVKVALLRDGDPAEISKEQVLSTINESIPFEFRSKWLKTIQHDTKNSSII